MESILVLNSDYTPLNITTFKRAIVLVIKGKAEILKDDNIIIRSETTTYSKPLIIRLFNYISHKMKNLRVNRHRLYKRDNNECAYCGSKKELTIDHIIPKSRGGKNTWNNLITCCLPCNLRKGDKTPEEAKMPLRFQPRTPTLFANELSVSKVWEDYKSSFVS
jgi:5-methylcytosine-specific restriction endonuclease McrA